MAGPRATSSQSFHPRNSVRRSNLNVFSDDFALEPLEMLESNHTALIDADTGADAGPRPSAANMQHSSSSQQRFHPSPDITRQNAGSQRSGRRSSVMSRIDSRASRSSYQSGWTESSDQGYLTSTPHRSSRTTSSIGVPRSQSPYQGPTGPSQPYGMYPQGITMTRTPSGATTSTIRPMERSYSGPRGPTQPYGMYPQGTVPEDDSLRDAAQSIAAGFPGLAGQEYQRRLGPDGEDADDLIGPDGYTEQLPPYTRYANSIPPKYDSRTASFLGPSHTGSRPAGNPFSDPEASSSNDATQEPPAERHIPETSDRRRNGNVTDPFSDSNANLNPTPASSTIALEVAAKDEANDRSTRLRDRAKKRVCCGIMPCWLLGFILTAILLAVIMGGIIGGWLGHEHAVHKAPQTTQTTITAFAQSIPTVTADAAPLSSMPPNTPPLPTGVFALSLNNPFTVTNSCLAEPLTSAWDCATGADLLLNITANGPPQISLSYPTAPNTAIRYGSQPPQLDGAVNLVPKQDRSDFSRGPAYFFYQTFNKTVIVQQSDLPPVGSSSKRELGLSFKRWLGVDRESEEMAFRRRDQSQWTNNEFARPNDRLWYCFWNGTVLEGFIYLQDGAGTTSTSAAASTPTIGMPSYKRQASPNLSGYPKSIKIEERRTAINSVDAYCQQMQVLDDYRVNPVADASGAPITMPLHEVEPWVQRQIRPPPPSPPTYGSRKAKRQSGSFTSNCECEWKT